MGFLFNWGLEKEKYVRGTKKTFRKTTVGCG